MKDRFTELWQETMSDKSPCPQADPDAVLRRVDAALDAVPEERRSHMNHKLRMTAAAAAAVLVLTTTAVAAVVHNDLLANFFKGDTAPGQTYLDDTVRTAEDGNYLFTVEGAAADENTVYLTVEVTAKNDETREFLFSDEFWGMDTFSARALELSDEPEEGETGKDAPASAISGLSSSELESASEDSRRFGLRVRERSAVTLLWIRCGYMEDGCGVELPVSPAPSVTVELNASGTGVCDFETLAPGVLTIDRVRLTPFTCTIEIADAPRSRGSETDPNLAFRLADGTIRTQNQLMEHTDSRTVGEVKLRNGVSYGAVEAHYQFRQVQDLDDIVSVIAFDVEYPLDGSTPVPLEHNPSLAPFTLPAMEPLTEDSGFSVSVQALTEALGGVYEWNGVENEAICTYRGVTIRLHPNENTVEVNGKPVALHAAPAMEDGILRADSLLFDDAWGIYSFVRRTRSEDGEITWHDWYIIP